MEPKVVKLKDLSSAAFMRMLTKYSACLAAKEFAKGKTLKQTRAACKNPYWMGWLAYVGCTGGWDYHRGTATRILPPKGWGDVENFKLVQKQAHQASNAVDWIRGQREACRVWKKYYKVEGSNVGKPVVPKRNSATRASSSGKNKAPRTKRQVK